MLQTERKTELDGLAMSILVVCCMFWGLQQVLVKATVPELPPVFQAFLRFVGATVLLVLWATWRRVPLLVDRAMWPAGLLAGALFSGEFAMLYMGLQYTTASRLTIFLYTSPFWVSALLPLFVRSESLRRIQWIGLACAFVAVGFAMQGGANAAAPQQWLGDTLALAAGLCWGLTTVTIRATSLARATPEQLLFCQIAVSAVTLPVLSLALGEQWTFEFSRFAAVSLFVQTVVGAFASYLAWMWLLGRYPATKISVFVFLTPLFALLFGALWLNEPITLGLACAVALVALGIVLVNAPARRV